MIVVGIDSGINGALAKVQFDDNSYYDSKITQIVSIMPMPITKYKHNKKNKKRYIYGEIYEYLKDADIVVIERVWARPNQSAVTTGMQMFGYGILLSIINIVKHTINPSLEILDITPATWKKLIFGPGKHEKIDSVEKALEYVDSEKLLKTKRSRVPSDDMAEALLIALCYKNATPAEMS